MRSSDDKASGHGMTTLPAPGTDQGVDRPQMRVADLGNTVIQQPSSEDSPTNRGRLRSERARIDRAPGFDPLTRRNRENVQRVRILLQLRSSPRQCVADSAVEYLVQQREHLGAQTYAREPRIRVMRIRPGLQIERCARRHRRAAWHAQQRACPRWVQGPHSSNRARSGTTAEPQQHRLGLIVERMSEQHQRVVRTRLGQRRVARSPGSSLHTAAPTDSDLQYVHLVATQTIELIGCSRCDIGRARLQTVIHNKPMHGAPPTARHMRCGCRERQRVGATGARHRKRSGSVRRCLGRAEETTDSAADGAHRRGGTPRAAAGGRSPGTGAVPRGRRHRAILAVVRAARSGCAGISRGYDATKPGDWRSRRGREAARATSTPR
jgi:hypothetical protein